MDKINANVYLTVAETGSFRKAADQLGYTQAGISYIVAAMEEHLGLTLFLREHGGVRLSPEGEALLPLMHQQASLDRQLDNAVSELKGLERGTLRVQIFDSISVHWLPDILRNFRQDYPGVRIELITEEDSVRAEQMVMSGEVDCGFFLTKVRLPLEIFELRKEKILAIVAKDHPLAKEKKFPIARLGDYPYITMKYDDHSGIGDIFKDHNVIPNVAFSMDNDYAAMAMVSKGLGYGISPELLLKNIPFELTSLEFDEPQNRIISIGTRSMETCSKACRKFMEYTLDWVKTMV